MKSKSFGAYALIVVGVFALLHTFGLLKLSFLSGFGTWWPIGLVLAGIAYVAGQKAIGTTLLWITAVLGVLYLIGVVPFSGGELREIKQTVAMDEIKSGKLDVDFGAGDISIGAGKNYLLENKVTTGDKDDPKVVYQKDGTTGKIEISRVGNMQFGKSFKNTWDLSLSQKVPWVIDLDYGAASSDIDLSELRVDELDIDVGAASSSILFGKYPTKVSIDVGASDLELWFPPDVGAKIDVSGGAVSTKLEGFEKKGGVWVMNEDAEIIIIIEINAGATSLRAGTIGDNDE